MRKSLSSAWKKLYALYTGFSHSKYKMPVVLVIVIFTAVTVTAVNYYFHKNSVEKPLILASDDDFKQYPKVDPVVVEPPQEYVEDSKVLEFKEGVTDEQKKEYIKSIGGTVKSEIPTLNTIVITIDQSKIHEIDSLENELIASSENDYYLEALEDEPQNTNTSRPLTEEEINNTQYDANPAIISNIDLSVNQDSDQIQEPQPLFNDIEFPNQWALDTTHLNEFLSLEDNSVKENVIAVIDSGVCLDHPDLVERLVDGFDFVENDNIPQDDLGHGCGVAGIIAANVNNSIGIVGATRSAKIMPLKVLDSKGIGTYSDVATAIIYAVDNGAQFINISLGGSQDSSILKSAVDYAVSKGVVVIASAGNTSSDALLYPAKYDNVISVGSVNMNLFVSKFSSRSAGIDFWAPGQSIISLDINNGAKYYSGTSFAAPYITSLFANGLLSNASEHGGFPTAAGDIMPVNFDAQSDEVLGWGDTDYNPEDVRTDVSEEYVTANSSTACVTRYNAGWWSGAYCYIEGLWEVNTNKTYQYQIWTSGKKYNFIYNNGAAFLGNTVRVEVRYTSQYGYAILSVVNLNQHPQGYLDNVDVYNLTVNGWSFDPDTPSQSNYVHIYIDGVPGSGAPGFAVYADKYRADVNAYFGISGNHAYNWSIPSQFLGATHTFYVYAIDTWAGDNPQVGGSPLSSSIPIFDYEPLSDKITTISSSTKTYGFFLPQGENADIISEANQNLSYTPQDTSDDPVNTATGFLDYSKTDMSYPEIAGIQFEFTRSYNSDSVYSGILGVGWQATFDMKLVPTNTNNQAGWTIIFPDGHAETFLDTDNNFRTYEYQFTAASSESKGVLTRYGSTGGPYPYAFVYTDSQTGQQFIFRSDRTAGSLYGKMIQMKYPNGSVVDYSYDTNGRILSAVEQLYKRRFDFTVDASGRLTTLKDAANRQVTFQYNVNGRLEKVTNPLGGVTTYTYNANNRISQILDPNNIVTDTFTYGSESDPSLKGKVISRTDGKGYITTYAYTIDGTTKITTITDPRGNVTIHKHNDKNYLIEVISQNGDSTKYEYDTKGNRTKETLPDGKIYQFGYDANGNRTTSTYPNGYVVNTTYNAAGKPTKIVEGNNDRVKYFSYDSNNNLVSSTDAEGKIFFYEYNNNKLLTKTTEATSVSTWSSEYTTDYGWNNTSMVRTTGDVNGDGKDDIIGFGMDHVYVALSNGTTFQNPQIWNDGFVYNTSWRVEKHPRMVADVNGDGKDDLIGFHDSYVYVALSTGTSFSNGTNWYTDFGYNQGWRVETHVRTMADVTGDGKADIVAISGDEVLVAKSTGTGFAAFTVWNSGYAYNDSWRVENNPRIIADVNGDGKGDLIGFACAGIYVSLSNGNSFVDNGLWSSDYGCSQGWGVTRNPRVVKDVNGDGKADVIGFGENATYVSISQGNSFALPMIVDLNYATNNNWSNTTYLRTVGDVDGDNKADLVGFGQSAVTVSQNNGNQKTYTYDANFYLNSETDISTNATTTYLNDAVGNRTRTTDSLGNISTVTYNGLNQKLTDTDARGNTKGYVYNSAGKLTQETDEANVATVYTYDGNYNVIKIQAGDKITQYEYDANNNKTKEIDPLGNYTTISYDNKNRAYEYKNYDKDNNLLSTNSIVYNSSDTKASETDANGNTTYFSYDSLGRLSSETKSGLVKNYTHDFWGNLTSETDWEGHTYTYSYNKLDQLILTKNPIETANGNNGTSYTYDQLGNIIKITDSLGQVTQQFFDSQKNLVKVINPQNQVATFAYDKEGRLTQQINYAGETTIFSYDGNGNLLSKTDNLGNITTFTYDVKNQNVGITDANGYHTTLAYDQYGNNTSVTNHLGYSKQYSYDLNGNMISLIDEEANVMTFAYDGLNRKISEKKNKSVDGVIAEVTETFAYDSQGNLTSQTDGKGNTTTYSYDQFDRITTLKNPDNTTKSFTYSGNGNLLTNTDENGNVTTYTYDALNRKVQAIDSENHTATYSYDLLNRVTQETDFKGQITSYTYDASGNVTKVTDRKNLETTLTYDNGNRVTSVTYPNGLVLTNTYDGVGNKLSETSTGSGLITAITKSYTYDKLGNVKTETDGNGNITTYNYNSVYQLTSVSKPLGVSVHYTYDKNGNVKTQTDENGSVTTLTYDPAGSIVTKVDALGISENYKYDANGNLISTTDGNGNSTAYTYNSRNQKIQVTLPGGVVGERYEYDNTGNVTKKYDANNNSTTYTYYSDGQLHTVIDALNQVTTYEYDANNNLTKETNKADIDTVYTYDQMDRITQKTDEGGNIWQFGYDNLGNITTITDPKNRIVTNTYDALGRKVKTTQDGGSLGLVFTSYEYDKNGNLVKQTDPNGHSVTYVYNTLNRQTKETNDNLEILEYQYDGVGNLVQYKDQNGNITNATYDALSRKTASNESGFVTNYTYDNVGNLLTTTYPRGNSQSSTYNNLNRQVTSTDGEGNTTTYSYDNNGNLISITNPNGTTYSYTYDVLNRETQKSATPNGGTSTIISKTGYDSMDRIVSETDAEDKTTHYEYDNLDNLTKVTDALDHATNYTYDSVGNLVTETNANNATTSFTYDNLDNLIQETDALNHTWNYEYDKNGNIIKETDANGAVNNRTYDVGNRILSKVYVDNQGNPTSESVYFEYDKAGNLKKASNFEIINNFTFDARSNVVSTNDSRGYTQSYTYDANSNLASLTFPDGKVQEFSYNNNDQISELKVYYSGDSITANSPALLTTTFDYDVNGNLVNQVNPDKTVITKTYDAFDQVTQINNYKHGTNINDVEYVIAKYTYTLDKNGNKLQTDFYSNCDKTDSCANTTTVTTHDTYTYDALGRVKNTTHTVDDTSNSVEPRSYTNVYTYDAVGNRLTMSSDETGTYLTTNYTFNLNNQLLTEVDGSNNWTYTYDSNGNRTTKTNSITNEYVNMAYNRAGEMVGTNSMLKNESGTEEHYDLTYKYDALGRRIQKDNDISVTNTAYNNIESQSYVYMGINASTSSVMVSGVEPSDESWNMISEYTTKTTGTNVHTNYYLGNVNNSVPSVIASEDVFERTPESDVILWDSIQDTNSTDPEHNFIVTPDSVQKFSYYQRDALDSIVSRTSLEVRYNASDETEILVVDPTIHFVEPTTVSTQSRTDEYGNKLNETQVTPLETGSWSSRSYSGQVYDIESNTYYYGSRNYDPTTGTWTKLDSYRGVNNNPLSRNRYIFVNDNPVNLIDRYGYLSVGQTIGLAKNMMKVGSTIAKVVVTAKKDPEKATVALTTGLYESKQQGSLLAGMNVTHEILENNQQYEKAVKNLPNVAQNMPSEEVIEKGMKEIWARGIVDSYHKNTDLSISYSNRLNLKASENTKYDLSNGVNQYEQEVLSLLNYRMTNSIIDGYQCNGKNTVECARMSTSFSLALQNGNENTNKAVGIDMSFKQGSGLKKEVRFDLPLVEREPELYQELYTSSLVKSIECGNEMTFECEMARSVVNGNQGGNSTIISERDAKELGMCMVPGFETVCDAYYAIGGRTFTGDSLSWTQRMISAAAVILPLGGSSIINKSDDIIDGANDVKKIISKGNDVEESAKDILLYEERTLQHTYTKHSSDFGMLKNWNKSTGDEFAMILQKQIDTTKPIKGTYRGTQKVYHYYNDATKLNVMTDYQGNLIGAWKLSPKQINNLLRNGNIQ